MQYAYIDSIVNPYSYISLSDSFLYIILSKLKLNQRQALSGLDNITVAGLSAINNLIELVKKDRLTIIFDKKDNCF